MKIYKDVNLTQEISEDTLDLGTIMAGDTKIYEFYIYNDNPKGRLINLEYSINSEEIQVVSSPKELNPKETGKLIINYSPVATIEEGLRAKIKIKGFAIYS